MYLKNFRSSTFNNALKNKVTKVGMVSTFARWAGSIVSNCEWKKIQSKARLIFDIFFYQKLSRAMKKSIHPILIIFGFCALFFKFELLNISCPFLWNFYQKKNNIFNFLVQY